MLEEHFSTSRLPVHSSSRRIVRQFLTTPFLCHPIALHSMHLVPRRSRLPLPRLLSALFNFGCSTKSVASNPPGRSVMIVMDDNRGLIAQQARSRRGCMGKFQRRSTNGLSWYQSSATALDVVKPWQFAHDSQKLVLFSLALLSTIHKDNRVADLQHVNMRNGKFRYIPIVKEKHQTQTARDRTAVGAVELVIRQVRRLENHLCS